MSVAADRLARSRLAIIEQVQHRERRHERRSDEDEGEQGRTHWWQQGRAERGVPPEAGQEDRGPQAGWFGHVSHMLGTWWRHHPAHMGLELATPLLETYARRKPLQLLGIAAVAGAVIVVARPWRLISATGLLVAVLKSSQLSGLVMSALSAADFEKDRPPRR